MRASRMDAGIGAKGGHVWALAAALVLSTMVWTSTAVAQLPTGAVSLNSDLAPYLDRFQLPAVAAAAARSGKIVSAGATGTRRVGTDTPVTTRSTSARFCSAIRRRTASSSRMASSANR